MTDQLEIRVRYTECDPMGVAHHAVYPVWFEMGRTELLRGGGVSYRDLEEQGFLIAVVKLAVQYKRPARYDDLLVLATRITDRRRATIDHAYELKRDGILLTTAATTVVCLDRAGRPQPLPDSVVSDQ
jgi:acyl-CoA thioester hydrolase